MTNKKAVSMKMTAGRKEWKKYIMFVGYGQEEKKEESRVFQSISYFQSIFSN